MLVKNSMANISSEKKRKRIDDAEEKEKAKPKLFHRPLYNNIQEVQKEVDDTQGKFRSMDVSKD